MEYLDIYDEEGNYIGKEDRNIVHQNALWHKTVHCWLYDKKGNIYFQIRKDEEKLYTTASGHIKSGESVEEGFGREIKEEIGINVDINNLSLIDVHKYVMDLVKKDGTPFKDRAFVNLYAYEFEGDLSQFKFDQNELNGLVKVKASDTIKLFRNEINQISGYLIKTQNNQNIEINQIFKAHDFLLCTGENLVEKYGTVLNKVIDLSN